MSIEISDRVKEIVGEAYWKGYEAGQKGSAKQEAIEFVEWLGVSYGFNEFENKWGKFWETEEGNSGFDAIDISELHTLYLQSKNKQ